MNLNSQNIYSKRHLRLRIYYPNDELRQEFDDNYRGNITN